MNTQPESDFCWIRIRILGPQDGDYYRVEAELDDGSWHKQRIKIGDAEEQELIRRRDQGTRNYGQYLYGSRRIVMRSTVKTGNSATSL